MFSMIKNLALAGIFAEAIYAKGINCDGSGFCAGASAPHILDVLNQQVDAGNGDLFFYGGQQLACSDTNGCAFFQFNGQNGNVNLARKLVQEIVDHGCKSCGSAPTSPGNPDVGTGCLTVNYVQEPCCRPENGAACFCPDLAIKGTPEGAQCQNCF